MAELRIKAERLCDPEAGLLVAGLSIGQNP
jgi:hypothetical protein